MKLTKSIMCGAALLASMAATPSVADVVITPVPTKIVFVHAYSAWGGGDIIFTTATPIAGCEGGWWLRPTDAGFQRLADLVTNAHMAGRHVQIWGRNDIVWNGAASPKICWVDSVRVL